MNARYFDRLRRFVIPIEALPIPRLIRQVSTHKLLPMRKKVKSATDPAKRARSRSPTFGVK